MVLGAVVVHVTRLRSWRMALTADGLAVVSAVALLGAAVVNHPAAFVALAVFALSCQNGAIPLYTQMFEQNYPVGERGKLFSATTMLRVATAALFAKAAGLILDADIGNARVVLILFSAGFALCGATLFRVPTQALTPRPGHFP